MTKNKFAALVSTNASVVNAVYTNTVRDQFDLDLVITDRICGAINFANSNQIPLQMLDLNNPMALNNVLDAHGIDYLYLFYTKIISKDVLRHYNNKIINFHPSLLPSCPGLNGFEDTLKSGALLAGSTVHFIDEGVDTGPQIMQTFTATKGVSAGKLRHIIFAQQCASLFQIHKKLKMNIDLLAIDDNNLGEGFYPSVDYEVMSLYRRLLADQ